MINKLARRNISFLFDKGKMSLEKLKDKCNIDGVIDHVTVAFPDQYGRLWSTHLFCEHFFDVLQKGQGFKYTGQSPFDRDVQGTKIEGIEPVELILKPDISTLRQSELRESGAFVLADCVDLPYAPRNLLKTKIQAKPDFDPQVSLAFSFGLDKFKPDENQVPGRKADGGLLGQMNNLTLAGEIANSLKQSGIPVSQFLQIDDQYEYVLSQKSKQTKEDLLLYADAYTMAKWMVKDKAAGSGFTSSFVPTEGSRLKLNSSLPPDHMLNRLNYYVQSLNAMRRIVEKERTGYDMLQPDSNLYLVFSDLLEHNQRNATSENEVKPLPKKFSELVNLIEEIIDEETECPVRQYYNAVIAHEIQQIFEVNPSEVSRVY